MLPDQAGGEDRCRDTGESWGWGGGEARLLSPEATCRDQRSMEGGRADSGLFRGGAQTAAKASS